MKDDKTILTSEGLKNLKEELKRRQGELRDKIANDIKVARDQGDLSENAAYKSAMEAKEFNENRIDNLIQTINKSAVKKANRSNNKVDIGEEFVLIKLDNKKKFEYTLVGETEVDPANGKISASSPIGSQVFGRAYGEKIKVSSPSGEVEFQIQKK